jgi:hypothetical protein
VNAVIYLAPDMAHADRGNPRRRSTAAVITRTNASRTESLARIFALHDARHLQ